MKKPKLLTFETALEAIVSAEPNTAGPKRKPLKPPKIQIKKRAHPGAKKSPPRAGVSRPQDRKRPVKKPRR